MPVSSPDVRSAVAARDTAQHRVRTLTALALGAAAALTGVFTAIAAGSTSAKKIVHRLEAPRSPVRRPARVVAPAPTLFPVGERAAATPPATPAPAPTPAEPAAPPVVVSGGS